jgi:hypothetical protein
MPLLTLALVLLQVTPQAAARSRVVELARAHLGEAATGGDCSGFVETVFAEAGVPLPAVASTRSRSEAIFRGARRERTPHAGDLAVFHNTYDRNRNGRADDLYSHVGIVEAVHGAQVTIIHLSGSGVQRLRLDLRHRASASQNSVLRRRGPGDSPRTKYLAGQLLAGFASPFARPVTLARRSPRGP